MCIFKKKSITNQMSNNQAIKLLIHIGNNVDRLVDSPDDVEIYLLALEKAIDALKK